ncbi:NAD(P)H-binding protein [Thiorhodococcus mannitoliphagus]|uniref:NAD(P)H-binding protein n=1 Tax=Thiorhodococcus mannitoliphagus TaxID=329406 RepID=A0A6P1E4C8_9GAMM|nr:NAD(P)H-binding protein [Thiorhodococcus mannitoliphagus]
MSAASVSAATVQASRADAPVYFLTGATGAIGSALVPLLLEDPAARVQLLLRADADSQLAERLETLYAFCGIPPEDSARRARVQALRGDVTLPEFGLDAHALVQVREHCTRMIHAAGIVRMNLPLEEARRAAVGAAAHLIELAGACPNLRKIEFVSTVGVGGRLTRVPETWIDRPRGFHNTYEQAKAEAEDLIRAEVERGLPLTVHRPSMVVGDSQSGRIIHFQVFYHLCEFLSGRRTFGLSPALGRARLDIIPVDLVARALAWSSGHPDLAGQILHLCSGPDQSTPLTDLQEQVRRLFIAHGRKVPPRITLPPRLFTGVLNLASRFMDEKTRRAVGTLPIFLEYLASDQRFENTATRQLLARAGMVVPVWQDALDTVLGAYLRAVSTTSKSA